MATIPEVDLIALSTILLGVGIFGILTRRNFILLLIAVEIAINAAVLNFVTFAAYLRGPTGAPSGLSGQSIAVVLIGLAATEVAVGLAIVLAAYRNRPTVDVDEVHAMKG